MLVQIVITWKDEKLQAALKEALRRKENLTPVFQVAGERMKTSIDQNFAVGGRPTPWVPSKRVIRFGGKTLVLNKILQSSITYKAFSDRLVIGTILPYGAIQQFGGTIRKTVQVKEHWRYQDKAFGKPIPPRSTHVSPHPMKMHVTIPARPYLVVQDDDKQYIGRVAVDYILEPLK